MHWAAQVDIKTANGTVVMQPGGPACEDCWSIGLDVLVYDSWPAFLKDYTECSVIQDRVETIRERKKTKASELVAYFQQKKVTSHTRGLGNG